VVLPAASFAEKEGTFTNFEGRVQKVRKVIEPLGGSLPDGEIILKLAEIMDSLLPYRSPQEVLDEIEEMVPFYHHVPRVDADAINADWAEEENSSYGNRRLHKGLFPSGFGRFSSVEYIPPQEQGKDGYPFTLMVGSSRYHFGSGTRSSQSARLKRFDTEAFLGINDADAGELGIRDGDKVKVISMLGELLTTVRINQSLPKAMLYMPISFPQSPVYELFSTTLDHQVKAPALKSCAVRLERTTGND
jgi:predicted molibdopterin-dependent oxidoreductase YjgC